MPDLTFQVTGVKSASRGVVPLIQFQVALKENQANRIHSVVLHAQIQIQAPRRTYNSREKADLVELFGTPDQWGRTLRNRLWATAATTVGSFEGTTTALLTVPCTCDLAIAATKYFHALEDGEVPLLFLFSGTIFYADAKGQLQVEPISWNAESAYKMPVSVWKNIMEEHYPNSAWFCLRRDVFDRLLTLKRVQGDATWEQTIERLLSFETQSKMEVFT